MEDSVIGFLAGLLIGFMVGGVLFVGCGIEAVKKEAIKAGSAEWTISPEGERGFRWLPKEGK